MLFRSALDEANTVLEEQSAADVLRWAWTNFSPRVAASSSFQTQSMPLLHLISRVCPEMPILFLDTGFHFPETLAFRDIVRRTLGLRIEVLTSEVGHDRFKKTHGQLYRTTPDHCCFLNKVEPMRRARAGLSAWVSGIRRDQTRQRSRIPIVTKGQDGVLKIHPMARWTRSDVWRYVSDLDLPTHPLVEQGYTSIGCAPCTRQPTDASDERSGRWSESSKTECGLHLEPSGGEER